MPTRYANSRNRYYTKALFQETNITDKALILYTLKQHDVPSYPSLYKLYMEMDDLTEFDFASTYFDGWTHWTEICGCSWFIPYITRWRLELELRVKATALRVIRTEAADIGSKNQYSANKLLLEGGWKPKVKIGSTRTASDHISKEAVLAAERETRINDDYKRLGVKEKDGPRDATYTNAPTMAEFINT